MLDRNVVCVVMVQYTFYLIGRNKEDSYSIYVPEISSGYGMWLLRVEIGRNLNGPPE